MRSARDLLRVLALALLFTCNCMMPSWAFNVVPAMPYQSMNIIPQLNVIFEIPDIPPIQIRGDLPAKKPEKIPKNVKVSEVVIGTLIMEAVGEGQKGMIAVAEVIRNRAILFGKDVDAVCLAPRQFSCWNDAQKAKIFLAQHKNFFKAAKEAWFESEKSCFTHGATDYHADYVNPYWAKYYRQVARIESHLFYRRD